MTHDASAVPRVPQRTLGRTGLRVSCLAFGAGPVSGLMTGADEETQAKVVDALYQLGINWIDTAAGYGDGISETSLGRILSRLSENVRQSFHVATKVRVNRMLPVSVLDQIRSSVHDSLKRLQRSRVTLLQLHNAITEVPGSQPASVSVDDVVASGGILDALKTVQKEGLTQFLGLTGTGDAEALRQVIRTGAFDTIQIPFNLLNPSAGQTLGSGFFEHNYGNVLSDCQAVNMGCFAIRVFAGGALLQQPPSQHTHKTVYFPLDLYQRDLARAAKMASEIGATNMTQQAIRFVLNHPAISSAIIGFGNTQQAIDAARAVNRADQSTVL